MTSKQITKVLMGKWLGNRSGLPNYKGNGSGGESDLFIVTGSAYCEEVEIKISMADFRREFRTKKYKHGCLNNQPGYRFTHSQTGLLELVPRRFWFAVPSSIADQVQSELAGTCYGLLEITIGDRVIERIKPKAIQGARKLTHKELVALTKCMSFRIYNSLRKEVHP